ncbi:hypothetical protein [Sphaerimonospora mesophila]|uniref:hypothetical protein n=1 Tax=Sphaerimonospora mesophila TaxID=37483 RepID=UPI0006E42DA5
MEPELMALASSGAATLVGLMVSDSWERVKEVVARMLARRGGVQSALRDLDASRAGLLAGDESSVIGVESEWRARLCHLIETDPDFAVDLRHLLNVTGALPPEAPTGDVRNVISGGVQHGPVIQAGRISGQVLRLPRHPPASGGGDG